MQDELYIRLTNKLTFDPLEFDRELIELPGLMLDATEACSFMLSERDRAKNSLDITIAEAANELRSNPTTDVKGAAKQRSEAQIESEVCLYESVQKAQITLEKSKHSLALWQAMVDAVKTKRDSMRVFSDLTISGYLSPNHALDNRKAEIRAASTSPRRRINGA